MDRSKHTPPIMAAQPWRAAFLAALRQYPVIGHACEAAKVNYTTVRNARRNDPEFDEQVNEALTAGIDRAETEAIRRAVDGWHEPVVYQGRLCFVTEDYESIETNPTTGEQLTVWRTRNKLDANGDPIPLTINKRSDAMLNLVLKGRRKEVYSDRTELTGAGGGPVSVDANARAARLTQLLAVAKQRAEAAGANVDDLDISDFA